MCTPGGVLAKGRSVSSIRLGQETGQSLAAACRRDQQDVAPRAALFHHGKLVVSRAPAALSRTNRRKAGEEAGMGRRRPCRSP